MNRGFSMYFREGNRYAKETFKNKKFNYIKCLFVVIFQLLCIVLIPLYPVISLFRVRLARIAKAKKDICILKSFEGTNKLRSYVNVIFADILVFVFFITGLLLILIIGAVLFAIGLFATGSNSLSLESLLIPLLFTIPAIVVLVAYILVFLLYFAPLHYVVDRKNEMGISNILFNAFDSMKRTGKRTVFALHFVYGLIYLLLAIIFLGIPVGSYFIFNSVLKNQDLAILIATSVAFASLLISFFVVPKFILAKKISLIDLYDDIVSVNEFDNEFNMYLDIKGTEIDKKKLMKKAKKVKIEKQEDLLVSLFTDTKPVKEDKMNPNPKNYSESDIVNHEELADDTPKKVDEAAFNEPEVKNDLIDEPITEESHEIEEENDNLPSDSSENQEIKSDDIETDVVHFEIPTPNDLLEQTKELDDSIKTNDEETNLEEPSKEVQETNEEPVLEEPSKEVQETNEEQVSEEPSKEVQETNEDQVLEESSKNILEEENTNEVKEEELVTEADNTDSLDAENDEFEAFANSLSEKKPEEVDEFEAFANSLSEKKPEEIDEFEAFANSLEDKTEEKTKKATTAKKTTATKKAATTKKTTTAKKTTSTAKKTTTKKTTTKKEA